MDSRAAHSAHSFHGEQNNYEIQVILKKVTFKFNEN